VDGKLLQPLNVVRLFFAQAQLVAGLNAVEWVKSCTDAAGNGKAGGAPAQAQGNIQG
jgi:hypothetical protein